MEDATRNSEVNTKENILVQIENKKQYLDDLASSLNNHDDLEIYKLLDAVRFNKRVDSSFESPYALDASQLVIDQYPNLAHFLSDDLIDYLVKLFPFFYYQEAEPGIFTVWFGNWWDRRAIGKLDALEVRFDFDEDKITQLETAIKAESQNSTYNSEKINKLALENTELQALNAKKAEYEAKRQDLLDQKAALDEKGGIFELNKARSKRQELDDQIKDVDSQLIDISSAPEKIKDRQKIILNLSKEDTILKLESDAIKKHFNDFYAFIGAANHIYQTYLTTLIEEKEGLSHAE